jgi:hypothetical protein
LKKTGSEGVGRYLMLLGFQPISQNQFFLETHLYTSIGISCTQINDISPELVQCFLLDKTIALSDQIISGSTTSDYLGL